MDTDDAAPGVADRWFGINLQRARQAAGISQTEFAARMQHSLGRSFSQQTLSKIENGSRAPKLSEAFELARLARSDLMTLSQEPEEASAALKIRLAARDLRDARDRAEAAAAEFAAARDGLRELISEVGATAEGRSALALKLSWEG